MSYFRQRADLLWARHSCSSTLFYHTGQLRTVRNSLNTESIGLKDCCSRSHCKPIRLLQQCLSSDKRSPFTSYAVETQVVHFHHTEAQIIPHYSDIASTYTGCLSANTWRSVVNAYDENDNLWATLFAVSGSCVWNDTPQILDASFTIIRQTVAEQKTIGCYFIYLLYQSFGPQDMIWRYVDSWLFRP